MTGPSPHYHQLEVLVLRADMPAVGFRWELREGGKGTPLQAGEMVYASIADARHAGQHALDQVMAVPASQPGA